MGSESSTPAASAGVAGSRDSQCRRPVRRAATYHGWEEAGLAVRVNSGRPRVFRTLTYCNSRGVVGVDVVGIGLVWCAVAEGRVEPLGVVAELDVPGDVLSGVFPGRVGCAVDPLDLYCGVEGFGLGVIVADTGTSDRPAQPEFLGVLGECFGGVLGAAVGVEYGVLGKGVVGGGHVQRSDDEIGAHVVGHRVADARFRVTVDDGRQIEPSLPGADVGDVPDERGSRCVGGEVSAYQVGDRGGVAGDRRDRPPRPRLAGHQAQLAHQPADQLIARLHAEAGKLSVHASVAVGAVGLSEDVLDEDLQLLLALGGRRFLPAAPLMKPRPRHVHPLAHLAGRVVSLLGVDELVLRAHRYSWAKKAAAFPRNSAFIHSSRTSFSSSRSRARSETVSGGSSSACSARYLFTQFPSVPSFTRISRATSAIGRDVSVTIFTASSLNSGVKLLRSSGILRPTFRTADLIRSAVRNVGGSPMSPVVAKADAVNPRLTREWLEYSQARGFVTDPARVRHPRDKPRVESGVHYVQGNFFAGESFLDLADARSRMAAWLAGTANTRVHGTTRQVPAVVFAGQEAPCLLPAPGEAYQVPYWAQVKVHVDYHIQVARALYSVPWRHIGAQVMARADDHLVKVYLADQLIKTHPRQREGGRSTDAADMPPGVEGYATRTVDRLVSQAGCYGQNIGTYAQRLLDGDAPWMMMRSVYRLIGLAKRYGAGAAEAACARALDVDVINVSKIESMLKNATENAPAAGGLAAAAVGGGGRFARDPAEYATATGVRLHVVTGGGEAATVTGGGQAGAPACPDDRS